MFCSNCGKTIPENENRCPSCLCPIGSGTFYGASYTSVQMPILPNRYRDFLKARTQAAPAPKPEYVKADEVPAGENEDGKTTYVQLYDGAYEKAKDTVTDIRTENENAQASETDTPAELPAAVPEESAEPAAMPETEPSPAPIEDIPEETPIDVSSLSEAARASIASVSEELKADDMEEPDIAPGEVVSNGQAGISREVDEMIAQIEQSSARRQQKRRPYGQFGKKAPRGEEEPEAEEETPADAEDAPANEPEDPSDTFMEDEDEDEYYEDDEEYYSRRKLIIIIVASVLAVLLVVGGVLFFVNRSRNSAPVVSIEGVTEDLHDSGIELIKSHAASTHVNELMSAYAASGSLDDLNSAISASAAEVSALEPSALDANNGLFITALQTIEGNIANCVTADAINGTTSADADSAARWAIVSSEITALEKASVPSDLNAIINTTGVEAVSLAVEATATPAPSVNDGTFSKGDSGDDVLKLQNRLYELGYLLDDRDGTYGTKTQTAVKMFQQAAGLEITGICDSATLTAIYADDAPKTEFAQSTSVSTAAEETAADTAEETPEETETEQ